MKAVAWISLFFLVFCSSTIALCQAANAPLEAVKGPLDAGLQILKDPQYAAETRRDSQKAQLWSVFENMFDFTEISKRALAKHWRSFNPSQREQFSDLFAQLLGHTYITRIQAEYQGEEIEYLSVKKDPKRSRALIETRLVSNTRQIPIEYMLHLEKGKWLVYDVKVEGVSLVKNYRTQFDKILFKDSPEILISRLQTKVDQLKN
jgi:phospholipid transport system substrate-binding protein